MLTTRRLFQIMLFGGLFALALQNVTDGDFWWHLRTGQYILETGSIPHQDIFSYTFAGHEWVTHEWLSQILIAGLYRLGGFPLLILVFAGITSTSFFIAFRRSTGNIYIAALATLVGALATAILWDVRPQIIALLLTSIEFWILDRYRANKQTRAIWFLPLLMLVWVNAHGSFMLAPALVALTIVGEIGGRAREGLSSIIRASRDQLRLAVSGVLLLLAISLNPNGLRMYAYPFEVLNENSIQSFINEWQSPDFHRIELLPFAVFILAVVFVLAVGRRRPSFTLVLFLVFTLFESLRSVRFIPLFVLTGIPLVADSLPPLSGKLTRVPRWMTVSNAALLVLLSIAIGYYAGLVFEAQPKAEQADFPVTAVDYLEREKPAGRLFNMYEWGGYVMWRLYPEQPVFIDGRSDVYGAFIVDYLEVYRGASNWRSVLDRYGVGLVLVSPQAPIATLLSLDSNWIKLFEDERAVLFQRLGQLPK
ncbi:MAG: hypothetical protein WCF84_14320 [Anaerolineae bacterium]